MKSLCCEITIYGFDEKKKNSPIIIKYSLFSRALIVTSNGTSSCDLDPGDVIRSNSSSAFISCFSDILSGTLLSHDIIYNN